MKYLYSLTGATNPVIKEFEIDADARIMAGELVVFGGNRKGDAILGTCMGVAAEDHTGEKDILNERSDKNKLRVNITRGAVYEINAPKLVATQGSGAGELVVSSYPGVSANFSGGKLVMAKKGEGSANTREIGTVSNITSAALDGTTLTIMIDDDGIISTGDEFAIIPKNGYVGDINDDRKTFILWTELGVNAQIVGNNEKKMTLEVVLDGKMFD